MKQCSKNENHLYPNHLSHCPWCKIAKETGKDSFPSKVGQQIALKAPSIQKGRQVSSSPSSTGNPILEINKKNFEFLNMRAGSSASGSFTISNIGGDTLSGSISTNKRWLRVNQNNIDTSRHRQDISFYVDTSGFNFGSKESGIIEIQSNGGTERIYISFSIKKNTTNIWLLASLSLLIFIIIFSIFDFDNKNIQEISTPTLIEPPNTHLKGLLKIHESWSADLDEGSVSGLRLNDDFLHTKGYLSPRNGAKIAIVGATSVGINGCKTAILSNNRIDINDLSEGTYVCVLTNQGRFSEFRVNEPYNPSTGAIIITYTTWGTANPQSSSVSSSNQNIYTNSIGMEFVLIPAGEFSFKHAGAQRLLVKIPEGFYLGKYEVTQKQWSEIMGNNPSFLKGDEFPVIGVTWDGAQEFINKLNSMEDTDKYRLPSDVEWQYSAQAGNGQTYISNDECGNYAWYSENSYGVPHPVGWKEPNPWGLYDTVGNVFEWVYRKDDSACVLRGGAWFMDYCITDADTTYEDGCLATNTVAGFRLLKEV